MTVLNLPAYLFEDDELRELFAKIEDVIQESDDGAGELVEPRSDILAELRKRGLRPLNPNMETAPS